MVYCEILEHLQAGLLSLWLLDPLNPIDLLILVKWKSDLNLPKAQEEAASLR
jgi:hypothetical protein